MKTAAELESLTVLRAVSFTIGRGETCASLGPSGSGKISLLALSAGLDSLSSDSDTFSGHSLEALDEEGRARVRNKSVGFVFQKSQLIPTLPTLENVMVSLELRGKRNIRGSAVELLGRVGFGGQGRDRISCRAECRPGAYSSVAAPAPTWAQTPRRASLMNCSRVREPSLAKVALAAAAAAAGRSGWRLRKRAW